ncbi:MAG TPA: sodium:proton exchanger [Actinomycetes bacterium]|nr:sodium:proton exchanger [Actinomycetes bacterium]
MAAEPEQITAPTKRGPVSLALAVVACLPGAYLGLAELFHIPHPELAPPLLALTYGVAVIGAAFVLAWAAEAAQLDVSASLAIGVLALIAVLPEYAVGFVFAWKGGNDFSRYGYDCKAPDAEGTSNCALVLANMTGANRLLIGIGWSLIVFIAYWQWRRRGERRGRHAGVTMDRSKAVELAYLSVACAYCLTLPLRRSVTLLDAVILVSIFIAYTLRISKAPQTHPDLIGPAAWIGEMSKRARRTSVLSMFAFAGIVILLVAEHFAESLVETGTEFGVSEFLLVQWLAPLASEAPELLVVALYAWRLKTSEALTAVVSSKINQWTLLVGTLPLVFAISSGSLHGLPVEATQRQEVLLTAAQTVFAVAILVNLSISLREAFALFGLFWAQFILGAIVPASSKGLELMVLSGVYILLGVWLLARKFGAFRHLLRDGFRTPYSELEPEAATEGPSPSQVTK